MESGDLEVRKNSTDWIRHCTVADGEEIRQRISERIHAMLGIH